MQMLKFTLLVFFFGTVMHAQQQAAVNFSVRVMDFQSISVENVQQNETNAVTVSENILIKIKGSSAYELQVSSYKNLEAKANNQYAYNDSLANSTFSKEEIAAGLKKANYHNSRVVSASRNNLKLYYDPSEMSKSGHMISYSVMPH
ncbi:MAG TPA: hypothetical protein VFD80_08885 [Flavobacteriaceae bacterium]|nr:hypothetical protein [Flavobacteriaceae bacterium]